ncbi:MAG: bifunctional adenosylcobinamide kinase/adenosylcobinamide-phosphate guanylyltransferase, partial [Lachnospiraceae bacterium]|nr:bifunctional adenosylcobinamide kinase/adenosylcobinamide-phosphate guanylyltransferase [Lachnospiraceae bacterium]
MIYLIIGGASSGKSAFGEDLAEKLAQGIFGNRNFAESPDEEASPLEKLHKIYLATMKNEGEEAEKRIARHRRLRAGKNFETLEAPGLREMKGLSANPDLRNAVVLLETLSVLVANEMFSECGCFRDKEQTGSLAECIWETLKQLPCRHLVLMSDEIFCDGIVYDEYTESYRQVLGELHRLAAREGDGVFEVSAGIPYCLKGRNVMDETERSVSEV